MNKTKQAEERQNFQSAMKIYDQLDTPRNVVKKKTTQGINKKKYVWLLVRDWVGDKGESTTYLIFQSTRKARKYQDEHGGILFELEIK